MVCFSLSLSYKFWRRLFCNSLNIFSIFKARHVFGSIIGLHKAFLKLPEAKQAKVKVHFALLDIHPTTLCRVLVALMLLDDLLNENHTSTEVIEIKATLFYVYTAVLVPSYCFERYNVWFNRSRL